MASQIDDVRPPVISADTRNRLDRYRVFRHVVRHAYAFDLDVALLRDLVDGLDDVVAQVTSELDDFAAFLQGR